MKTKKYAEKLKRIQTVRLDKYQYYIQKYLKKYLPITKSSQILEVGCGIGNLMLAMKSLGYKNTHGFDIDSSNIRVCKSLNLSTENKNVITNKNKLTPTYDFIYSFDVIEHIPKQEVVHFIAQCFSLLKPNGRLVYKTQNMQNPFNLFSRYKDFTHTVGYTEEAFNQVMDELDLHNYKIFYGDGYVVYDNNIVLLITKFCFKVLLRILDLFIQFYLYFFLGGKWLNVRREVFLVILK